MSSERLQARYQRGAYSVMAILRAYLHRCGVLFSKENFDLVWIEKEAFPWWPFWLERFFLAGKPYALDFDDAIFHNYDQHRNPLVRRLFGRRLDRLMAGSALVVAGNPYLAQRARMAGAQRVEIVPTVIDLNRYDVHTRSVVSQAIKPVRIVWIGSPSTVQYLKVVEPALQQLAKSHTFVFRVIGGTGFKAPGVVVEEHQWQEDREVELLSECDIGIMPLVDSPFERGKCGYKLIQYMACGLPVVASPVGVNADIVQCGENGFLASSQNDWFQALEKLILNASLRQQLGQHGRKCVEQKYCIQVTAPRLLSLLRDVSEKKQGLVL